MKEDHINHNYKLEPFFELSPDLLIIAGYDGYFRKINPAVCKVLGYTEAELFARPIRDFIYQDDKEITAKRRVNLTKNNPLLNFENRYLTKTGEIVWLSWTSIPVDSEKLVYAIAKNITHKKMLEEQRNLLLTNLTKVNKDLKQFTYITAHDLRAPVNNLLSIFSLLDVSKIQDKQTNGFIDKLKSATKSLKNTLNNYVDILIKNDRLNLPIEELRFEDTLKSVQHSIGALIDSSKVTFATDFSEVESIPFNKSYLESIFLNLITNSIKYSKPDQLPTIAISTRKEGNACQLVFSDNGLGLDGEQFKHKVFGLNQRFHQETDSKGIGLYLIYNHITNLGGKIEVVSKVNEGATFVITFKG
jgi:PAS domain S-box-containing protein